MKILGISGWLQPPTALNDIVPGIAPFRYDQFGVDKRKLIQALGEIQPEVVIGWSLGGVLAVQGLLHPHYRPRKLVLISVPYCFLESEEVPEGMPIPDYEAFRRGYMEDPERISRRLQLLTNHGMPEDFPLCPAAENVEEEANWLPWLEHLAATDFSLSKYQHQPEVLLIHGGKDAICSPGQGKYWARLFPRAQVLVLPKAAHAPHVQAAPQVRRAIEEFMHHAEDDTQAAAS